MVNEQAISNGPSWGGSQSACELLRKLETPLEVLTNLNFLALQQEAECSTDVRVFLHMADDQMKVIHQIMRETYTAER